MYSKVMNKYFKNSPNKQELVTEGWGLVAARLILGPLANFTVNMISLTNLENVLKNPTVQKFIKQECDKIVAKEKKTHKDVTAKIPSGFFSAIKQHRSVSKNTSFLFDYKHCNLLQKVQGYEVMGYGDTDHVERVYVCLYIPSKDEYIARRIPSPTREDLKRLGYRQEEH